MRLLLITAVYPTPRRPNKGTFNRELVAGLNHAGKIKTRGLEPVKSTEGWAYPVEVVFPSREPLRAGTPAQLTLP